MKRRRLNCSCNVSVPRQIGQIFTTRSCAVLFLGLVFVYFCLRVQDVGLNRRPINEKYVNLRKYGSADVCEVDDEVCRQCPYFRFRIQRMTKCMETAFTSRLNGHKDVSSLIAVIPFAVKKCSLKWLSSHPAVQLIRPGETQILLPPVNRQNNRIDTLVIGDSAFDYELERQLRQNNLNPQFYGLNIRSSKAKAKFKNMLYGILVGRNLDIQSAVNVADHGKPSTRISPITSAYFGQRPVDFIFLHLTNLSRAFVEQLMGHGPLALQYPACQLNIEIEIPTQPTELRQFIQWFKQLSTIHTAERNQYVIGYSTIVQSTESNRKSQSKPETWRLRFFAVNVGQPHCAMRFFSEQECRPLLRNSWDFIKLFFHIPHGTLF